MTLPNSDPAGYGPLGTPNAGRTERIAKCDRERARQYRAAADRLNRGDPDEVELRSLRHETRYLRDQLAGLRADLAALVEAEVERVVMDQLPEALEYLLNREVTRNGTAQAPRR